MNNSERLSRLTGCKLPATNQNGHCGLPLTYRMTWALSGGKLTFSDYVGEIPGPQYLLGSFRKIA